MRVFISYRREDSKGYSGRLQEHLSRALGEEQVFRDIDSLGAGVNFKDEIDRRLAASDTVLVLIGEHWERTWAQRAKGAAAGPDLLRREIELALASDLLVVPVLMPGAVMPAPELLPESIRALVDLQAHELSDAHWDESVGRLLAVIGVPHRGRRLTLLRAVAVLLLLASAITFVPGLRDVLRMESPQEKGAKAVEQAIAEGDASLALARGAALMDEHPGSVRVRDVYREAIAMSVEQLVAEKHFQKARDLMKSTSDERSMMDFKEEMKRTFIQETETTDDRTAQGIYGRLLESWPDDLEALRFVMAEHPGNDHALPFSARAALSLAARVPGDLEPQAATVLLAYVESPYPDMGHSYAMAAPLDVEEIGVLLYERHAPALGVFQSWIADPADRFADELWGETDDTIKSSKFWSAIHNGRKRCHLRRRRAFRILAAIDGSPRLLRAEKQLTPEAVLAYYWGNLQLITGPCPALHETVTYLQDAGSSPGWEERKRRVGIDGVVRIPLLERGYHFREGGAPIEEMLLAAFSPEIHRSLLRWEEEGGFELRAPAISMIRAAGLEVDEFEMHRRTMQQLRPEGAWAWEHQADAIDYFTELEGRVRKEEIMSILERADRQARQLILEREGESHGTWNDYHRRETYVCRVMIALALAWNERTEEQVEAALETVSATRNDFEPGSEYMRISYYVEAGVLLVRHETQSGTAEWAQTMDGILDAAEAAVDHGAPPACFGTDGRFARVLGEDPRFKRLVEDG